MDPQEAARGRLDFAQVDSWDERALAKLPKQGKAGVVSLDDGNRSAVLDELEIRSFAPDSAAEDAKKPFYEQARRE